MDGVLYLGDNVIEGARNTIEDLHEARKTVNYLTNFPESRKTVREKLRRVVKVDAPEEAIMTAAYATALYIQKGGSGIAYVLGLRDLEEELEVNDIKTLSTQEVMNGNRVRTVPDWVVVSIYDGNDFYQRLNAAGNSISSQQFNPAHYLATSKGFGWTREDGITPGAGATIAALKEFSKKEPIVIGKPSNILTDLAFSKWKINPSESVLVGDKWSDIETANEYSILSIKVETGKQDFFESIEKLNDKAKPKLVLKSINGIFNEDEIIYSKVVE